MRIHGSLGVGPENSLIIEPELSDHHEPGCPYLLEDIGESTGQNLGPRITVLSGPSGSGKGTIVSKLTSNMDESELVVSRSYTDRAQRPGEPDDAYHFVSREEMQRLIDEDFFMEWAEFVDHRKGSASVVGLLATSRRVLFEIDMVGADILREQHPDLNHMFVLPESLKQLAERQRGRGDEDEAIIEARVAKAREEFLAAEVLAGGIELAINSDGAADAVAAQLGALACGIRLQPVDTRLHAKQHLHELVTA